MATDGASGGNSRSIVAAIAAAVTVLAAVTASLMSSSRVRPMPFRGCDVVITNMRPVMRFGARGAAVTIQGISHACPISPVDLYETAGPIHGDPGSPLATVTTDSSGAWSWDTTLPDQTVTTVTARMAAPIFDGGPTKTTSAWFVAHVDTRNPDVVITSPAMDHTLIVTVANLPDGGAVDAHVARAEPGYTPDSDAADGAQVTVQADVYVGAASSGTLSVVDSSGGNAQSFPLSTNPTHVAIALSFDAGFVGKLTLAASTNTGSMSEVYAVAACNVAPIPFTNEPAWLPDGGAGSYAFMGGFGPTGYGAFALVDARPQQPPGACFPSSTSSVTLGLKYIMAIGADAGLPLLDPIAVGTSPVQIPPPGVLAAVAPWQPTMVGVFGNIGESWCAYNDPAVTSLTGKHVSAPADFWKPSTGTALTYDVPDGGAVFCVSKGSAKVTYGFILPVDAGHPTSTIDFSVSAKHAFCGKKTVDGGETYYPCDGPPVAPPGGAI